MSEIDNADVRHSFDRLIGNPRESRVERLRDRLRLGQDKRNVDSAQKNIDLVIAPNGVCPRTENL